MCYFSPQGPGSEIYYMSTETKGVTGFESLGIAPKLLQILQKNNYTKPTPIQEQAIPIAIAGDDVIGIAQTGTGKTLAFGLPMIQRLAGHKGKGLVVLPTRELALQVEESLHKIGAGIGLKTAVLIGSEGYCALRLDRRFYGCELKREYYETARRNLAAVEETKASERLLF